MRKLFSLFAVIGLTLTMAIPASAGPIGFPIFKEQVRSDFMMLTSVKATPTSGFAGELALVVNEGGTETIYRKGDTVNGVLLTNNFTTEMGLRKINRQAFGGDLKVVFRNRGQTLPGLDGILGTADDVRDDPSI